MKFLFAIIITLATFHGFAQNKRIEKLKEETLDKAYLLYKSELASWHSTDLLLEHFKEKRSKIGGYLSYTQEDKTVAIYFDRTTDRNVILSFTYENIIDFKNLYETDTVSRTPTQLETRLIVAREMARQTVSENEDKMFTFYKNSSYNYVPIIYDEKIVVYSLTGPQEGQLVLIGNDYKFEFDKKDRFKKASRIHNSLLRFPFQAEEGSAGLSAITHSHIIKEYPIVSETDLCTLMLYEPYVEWNKAYIINEDYVSIWDMEKRLLVILTMKAWERISEHQETKN